MKRENRHGSDGWLEMASRQKVVVTDWILSLEQSVTMSDWNLAFGWKVAVLGWKWLLGRKEWWLVGMKREELQWWTMIGWSEERGSTK